MYTNNFDLASFTLTNNGWLCMTSYPSNLKFEHINNGFEFNIIDETLEINLTYSITTTPINKKTRVVIGRNNEHKKKMYKKKIVLDTDSVSNWVTNWINEDYAAVYSKTLYKDELMIDEAMFDLISLAENDCDLLEDYECSSFKEYIEEIWVYLLPNKEQVLTAYTKVFVSNYSGIDFDVKRDANKKEYTLDEIENLIWAKYKYSIKEFLTNKYNNK